MKKFLYIIIFLLILTPNVYAQDFTVSNSDVSSPNSSGTGKYTGTEIYNSGTSNVYNIGTRYNGRLSRIIFNLASGGYADSNGFEKGHTYTLTLNMATEDWRNNFGSVSVKCEGSSGTELSNGRVTYVSYKKIKFSFTAPTSSWCQFVYVDLKSSNINSTAFTGTSNWNLSSLIITDNNYNNSGGSSSATPSPSNDYSSIINNQNNNTQDIINNQNNNTQDIIENNNQNTQQIIDSNKVCNFIDSQSVTVDGYFNSSGVIQDGGGQWGITDFINVHNSDIKVVTPMYSGAYTCFYNINKVITGCSSQANFVENTNIFIPDNSYYARFSIYTTLNVPTFNVCTNGNQAVDNSIQQVNDTLNNDDIDDKTGFFTGFTNNMHGLSSIITIPLSTIQSLSNTTCVSLTLPIPFTNDTLTLPCMSEVYDTYAHDIYNLWQLVSFGIISYYICIDIFKIVKGFKDPNEDKIEVLDL